MSRYYLLCGVLLLNVSALLALNGLHANDNDKPAKPLPKDDVSEVAELVDRIEELEKRLTTLEGREPLIRQADSRESSNAGLGDAHPPVPTPTFEYADEEDSDQKTNGQPWRFRLLNYRQTSPQKPRAQKTQPARTASRGIKDSI